jgi:hypothetical protein
MNWPNFLWFNHYFFSTKWGEWWCVRWSILDTWHNFKGNTLGMNSSYFADLRHHQERPDSFVYRYLSCRIKVSILLMMSSFSEMRVFCSQVEPPVSNFIQGTYLKPLNSIYPKVVFILTQFKIVSTATSRRHLLTYFVSCKTIDIVFVGEDEVYWMKLFINCAQICRTLQNHFLTIQVRREKLTQSTNRERQKNYWWDIRQYLKQTAKHCTGLPKIWFWWQFFYLVRQNSLNLF